jgi:hypothetical protein
MLEFLFESGCNIVAQDNSGQTAAHYGAYACMLVFIFPEDAC